MDYQKLKDVMNAHALDEYPREAVGIITLSFDYIRCNNLSLAPKVSFYLDPEDLLRNDGNIWGIFHSHPGSTNPIPSKEDKISAAFNEYKFIVGFDSKFFIYWYDEPIDALRYTTFEEHHLDNNT